MTKSIKELIYPSRHTELTVIRSLRITFLSFFYAGVVIYLCLKAFQLHHNETFSSFKREPKDIPAPTVTFLSSYTFIIKCTAAYSDNTTSDCTDYVNVDDNYQDGYALTFKAPEPDLTFAAPKNDGEANTNNAEKRILDFIDMAINIMDPTYSGDDASLFVLFLDKDTLPNLQELSQKPAHIKGLDNFIATALADNSYLLANNQSYAVYYERKIFKALKQNAVNILIGKGGHNDETSLNTKIVSYPNFDNPEGYASIIIQPSSYEVETETENPVITVFDLISGVGGIHGAAMTAYVFVFGAAAIGPWGCFQRLPWVRREVRDRLRTSLNPSNIPSSGSEASNIPFLGFVFSEGLSIVEKIEMLRQRFCSLELFFAEYVVNAGVMINSDINEGDIERNIDE